MKYAVPAIALCLLSACSQPQEEGAAVDDAPAVTPAESAAPAETAYDGPIPMPIRIGGDGPDFDACGTYAEVAEYDAAGEDKPYVHDAPSASTKVRHTLSPAQGVQICASENGWSGIVYPGEGQTAADCGTGRPVASEENYTGPCRQGWVEERYLEMIAG
ncbi:hypothetical protein [Qipengyuania sp. NPDC077563]|uniref:hypothetical protein n=1 Tax=Qipengyuania sp. NPDC077563 TaxID=3364497 RepID=UPI00384B7AD9